MNIQAKRFFESIKFSDTEKLEGVTVEKVILLKSKEMFEVHLKFPNLVSDEILTNLFACAKKGINGEKKCVLKITYEKINNQDIYVFIRGLVDNLIAKRPSLIGIKDSEIKIDDEIIIVEVTSKIESQEIIKESKNIIKKMTSYGINGYEITTFLNKEKEQLFQEEMKLEKTQEVIVEKPKVDVFLGRHMEGDITLIDNILGDVKNVIIEAYVFGIDTLEKETINIATLKVSDKTNSILAKIFKKDRDDFKDALSNIGKGKWYRIHGNVEFDNFSKELVLSIRNMEKIPSKNVAIKDEAEKKRVELHAHTMMSPMDGVTPAGELINFASSLGHKAVAVTDHNNLQAYPDIVGALNKINKGKDEKEQFKVLYGVELNIVNDDVDIIYNMKDYNLLNDTFVVFDTETTGFYVGVDQLIEIGGVKIQNGEIIDRFDELINPHQPLPTKIVELTCITDDMLVDKDEEENVLKRFLEWVGDLPMVAHNSKFDISFMDATMKKYGLKEFSNTVIDTMSLARMLYPEWGNHKLSTLVKKLKVPWDESAHHRADYDSEGTAIAFYYMSRTLYDRNIETTTDLMNEIDIDELIKFSFPYHVTLIAKNQLGLKNLFKIISLANTKYLFKNDQPKLPKKEILNHREGLLVGSSCVNNEIFEAAINKDDEELMNMMRFYDYIEVQPPSSMGHLLQIESSTFNKEVDLENHIKKIIRVANDAGKIICATGDVHHLTKEDKQYREIIVNQKFSGKLHPLNRRGISVPDMHFLTTEEMLDAFSFLDEKTRKEVVITNPNKIADMVEKLQIIRDDLYTPKMDKSAEETKEIVYNKAHELYSEKLPSIVSERVEAELNGIIGGGFDVIYLIARKLVLHSNEDGYIVGSRGSVGSSFVATMMGITEVNGLPAHYLCPNCKLSIWEDSEGAFNKRYASGYDLPDKKCECGTAMKKEGQDMPFATFLGFNADKVPDIDLNFSGDNQAEAHNYTKVLFGEDRVYRAGTIGTVAEKTAYGYVKGYCEDKGISLRHAEIERLAQGCTGVKRTTGQHPGGIIVIPEYMDVYDFTAFQYPAEDPNSTWYTTHFDFHAIHDNVLKLDILGHDDPTVLRYLEDTTGVSMFTIPFDDQRVLSIWQSPKTLGVNKEAIMCPTGTLGVPEFGTNFVIKMLEDTKPKSFAELVKISGLSHGTDVWQGNASELVKNKTVDFKDIIGCRDDIMVSLINYGLEPGKAFKISEFVRKGKAQWEPDTWAEFAKDMEASNVPDWFIWSCGKIKYMFPKAHATAYVMMAYRVAWYKVYYPLHYYSAFFSIRCSDFDVESMAKGYDATKAKLIELQQKGYDQTNKEKATADVLHVALEMLARGYSFKMIDVYNSDSRKFIISEEGKSLLMPFIALDGLGDTVVEKIIEERNSRPFISIEDFQVRSKVSGTSVEKLTQLGALEGLPETSQLSLF